VSKRTELDGASQTCP